MNSQMTQLQYIEGLESIRHMFKPSNYRFILAEALVYYFSHKTSSPSTIRNRTNEVLKGRKVEPISLGFVRNLIEN
ncbi:hypothetical protein [Bacillus cihuensis]|uniref:hypothetical protein n=1 Tax=Bacillus cihuensis TaxID=1208599 RepID=UPI00049191F7|nr:hypothetical protein [Bacillus cihuensis]